MRTSALRAAPVAVVTTLLLVAIGARIGRRGARGPSTSTSGNLTIDTRIAPDASPWIASFAGDASAPAPPVRMQHGDRKRTGRSTARGPSSLRQRWKTPLGGAIEAQVVASPDEQTLYAATLGDGRAGGELVALARADGAVRFRVPLGARSYATPCVDAKGNVYSASDAKKLVAVSPDGHVRWTLDLDDEGDTACALADDGTIVLAAGRTLYAVTDAGIVAWRFAARGKIFGAPAIDDHGRVFFGAQDHHAYGVDRGKKAFAVDLGADVDGSPAIDDDGAVVLGTDGGEIVRLDADGGMRWAAHVGGFVRGPISIARGGDVIAGVYGPRSRMVRLDGKTGAEKASFDVPGTGALEFGVHGGAVEDAAGHLYFGGQDDRLYALAPPPASSVLFTLQTEGDVDAPPTLLADGALVVASDDGAVYYLEP